MIPDRWLMLLILFAARTAVAYQFQTVASAGPFLVEAFDIDFTSLGTLIGLYMLPGVLIALPGGVLGQRFGAKRVVMGGFCLMALGGALMAIDSLAWVFAGRLISGVGAVLVNVLMTKLVTDWFAGREIVAAMAIFVASWPLGIALGLVHFPPLAAALAWPAVMQAGVLAVTLSLLLLGVLYREPASRPNGGMAMRLDLDTLEWILISLAGFIWGTYNVAYVVLISFLPELFTAGGYSLAEASRIVSLLGWALILTLPLSGLLAQQLGRPNLLMIGGFLAVAVASAALPYLQAPAAAFVVIVLVIGLPAGLIMALPAEALRAENMAGGMGVFYTCHYAGMAILPALAGKVRDLSDSAAAPTAFAAAMMIVAALNLIGFRLARSRRDPGPVD